MDPGGVGRKRLGCVGKRGPQQPHPERRLLPASRLHKARKPAVLGRAKGRQAAGHTQEQLLVRHSWPRAAPARPRRKLIDKAGQAPGQGSVPRVV